MDYHVPRLLVHSIFFYLLQLDYNDDINHQRSAVDCHLSLLAVALGSVLRLSRAEFAPPSNEINKNMSESSGADSIHRHPHDEV